MVSVAVGYPEGDGSKIMRFKSLLGVAAALSMSSVSVMAAAAPVQQVAPAPRASANVEDGSQLTGGIGLVAILIVAGIAAIGIIAIINDNNNDDNPSSR